MHLDLSWIFSIFKVVKTSSDARSFRPGRNYFRYLWRAPRFYDRNVKSRCDATFSIPEELASTSAAIVKYGLHKIWRKYKVRPPESGSHAPFVPLLKYNVKPSPKASQNGRIPAGQNPFIHPHSHLSYSIFFPTVFPSQADSLLFLPPTPPHPPAPEPNPDYEFSTQSTTPSLSPLPIALSLEFSPLAAPPPPELVIKIAGPEGYLNSDGTALSKFSNLSIIIPDQAKDVAPSLFQVGSTTYIVIPLARK